MHHVIRYTKDAVAVFELLEQIVAPALGKASKESLTANPLRVVQTYSVSRNFVLSLSYSVEYSCSESSPIDGGGEPFVDVRVAFCISTQSSLRYIITYSAVLCGWMIKIYPPNADEMLRKAALGDLDEVLPQEEGLFEDYSNEKTLQIINSVVAYLKQQRMDQSELS